MSTDTKHKNSIDPKSLDSLYADNPVIEVSPAVAVTASLPVQQPTVLLSDTKNTVETMIVPEREETIINGKYTLDYEDDEFYYCYYQTTYRTRVLKDEAKQNIKYRDSKGRMLPGYSLIKETKSDHKPTGKKRKYTHSNKSAEKWLQKELLPSLIDDIENGDMPTAARASIKKDLMNYVKATMSKVVAENIVKIVNNEFDADDDKKNGNE